MSLEAGRRSKVYRLEVRQLEKRPRYRDDRARVKRELRAEVTAALVTMGRVTA